VLVIAGAFSALVLRLFQLQVVAGPQYRLASLDNIIQTVDTPAPRGDIYDRAGRPLAKNVNIFQLLYIPPKDIDKYIPPPEERERLKALNQDYDYLRRDRETDRSLPEIQRLAAYLGTTYVELMKRIDSEHRRVYGYQPVILVNELTKNQVVYLGEHGAEYDGTMIEQYAFKRVYPLGAQAAHLVGYTARVSEKDLEALKGMRYGAREYVGKEGVERYFEQLLHGSAGWRDIEVDRNRVYRKIVRQVKPTKGTDLYLTVDSNIQAVAQNAMGGARGAFIVSSLEEGHEGEILALVSSPTYDPNRVRESDYYAKLLNNERPLLNRAYRHAYPPGSTFKIVTATAALQEGVKTPGSGFFCGGKIEVGNRTFYCHNHYGHGQVSFLEAIAVSCDVAFYYIGMSLPDPPTTLKKYAQFYGLGAPVGLELPNEVSGVVPDAQWKAEHYANTPWSGESWFVGDTLNYAIGQGFLTATPLQVLWMAQLVATDGVWYKPRLLRAKTSEGRVTPLPKEPGRRRPLRAKVLAEVKQGMRLAVTTGTCKGLNLAGLSVCAKTGTAETGRRGEEDHAWVVAFYPMSKPKYALVVFLENGGHGSDTAVPKARVMLQFLRKYAPPTDAQ
jgi:penicillin-binding protein 2